ncbi:uncharacterized protein LOC126728216 [Quercus robur]|uniref:uncharacterized protein LOC126728216 n=1 Tax=Quercus robur TaxID=38942 RepID=UPI002163499A|nr:uncharacterized protein LOC126728216 [Quercus robur]
MNLHHRHVTDSNICDLCGEFPEDTVHAIWTCKEVAGVWSSLDWFHQSVLVQPVNYRELLARFMPSQDDYKAEIFAIAGWYVWNRRNAIHFNRAVWPVDSIRMEAGSFLQEFLQAREVELSPPRPQVIQWWRPPNPYIYKINFDVAVFQTSNLAGVGVIVRDNRGDSIRALTMPVPFSRVCNSVADALAKKASSGVGLQSEEWVKDARNEARAKALSRADVDKSLGALKQKQAELSEKLKEADKSRLSAKAGLKTVERDYCAETLVEALNQAGAPADSELRKAENVFIPEDIREVPAMLPPPEQLSTVQVPPSDADKDPVGAGKR